nr:MAG TPA: hypothetical protein [Caudoviricetes sp.]DAS65555.1 MAG TPA: hypothetical protein [Caudoviricetes sp.]
MFGINNNSFIFLFVRKRVRKLYNFLTTFKELCKIKP